MALGALLALLAALTTALAHALVKSGPDRLAVRALIGLTCASACLGPALYLGPPTAPVVPWLAASVSIHLAYQLALVRSYELSDFSVAFPIARAVVPIGSAAAAVVMFGEILTAPAFVGFAVVSLGLVLLTDRRLVTRTGVAAALLTGLLTTAYTLVDAGGVRAAADPLMFISWFFVVEGIGITSIFLFFRRSGSITALGSNLKGGLVAGVLTLVGFGSALYAFALAPVGIVAALRETSVAFGLIFAAVGLRERVSLRKIAASGLITLGAGSAALF